MNLKYVIAKGLKIILNPPALNSCQIEKTAKICSRSELTKCTVGRCSYVGYQGFLVNTDIGAFCSIGDRCSIGGAIHPMDYVSTSPVFHEGNNVLKTNFSNHPVPHTPKTIIENDVWIGQGVFVKAGVKISTGAVIGMGSVVTKDIGPYEVWAGNPAKMIKKRFDEETIANLVQSKWWEKDDEEIKKYAQFFCHPEEFIEKLKEDEE